MKLKGKSDKTLSYGILSLSIALIFLSLFLLVKSDTINFLGRKGELKKSDTFLANDESGASKKTYVDEELGYSISYPGLLEPRSIESSDYLSFIVFFVPEGVSGDGFAISVRENSLEEELKLIRIEIDEGGSAKLIKEVEVVKDGNSGWSLAYEPENPEEGEPKTIIIVNNSKYSYTISSTPALINEIFTNFNLLN